MLARRQLTRQFEQRFVDRYDELIARVPLQLLLGESIEMTPRTERAMYDYFSLCEEQLYYRRSRKISRDTWIDWHEGIAQNMSRKAFQSAWVNLKERSGQFQLLGEALEVLFSGRFYDPARPASRRRRL